MPLTTKEKILYHQVHPWKLIADIGCEPVSLFFLWRHELVLGLITHFTPPIAASFWLIRSADLEPYKDSRAGAYLRHHMTRAVEGVRLAGDFAMVAGAWFHHPSWIALGVIAIALAWCSGLARKPMTESR